VGLPPQRNVESALKLAWESVARLSLENACPRAGADFLGEGRAAVRMLGVGYTIDTKARSVLDPTGQPAKPKRQVLMLHYLLTADGREPVGREVGFDGVGGASTYIGPFRERVVNGLIGALGAEPQLLTERGRRLDGEVVDYGDAAMRFPVLPRVPITAILWRGDEELPPSGQIVFDAGITGYLPLEDIVVASEMLVGELSRSA
jgi:hypothetical protein